MSDMTLEQNIWYSKRLKVLLEEREDNSCELDFLCERINNQIKKSPKQYFHIPGVWYYVHGSELPVGFPTQAQEYQEFLKMFPEEYA
jgi:hypothetical protein